MDNKPFVIELDEAELPNLVSEELNEGDEGLSLEFSKTKLWADYEGLEEDMAKETLETQREIAAQLKLITAQLSSIIEILKKDNA